jgi:tetratricopeptide (TPR) repeat protein
VTTFASQTPPCVQSPPPRWKTTRQEADSGADAKFRYVLLEKAYREEIRLNPNDSDAYYGLGNVRRYLEQYPEAETAYREAIRLNLLGKGPGTLRSLLKEAEQAHLREAILRCRSVEGP